MISFILPIYKKSLETLKKSINSLLDQSYKDIEIICSFDGPDAVLESYVDSLCEKMPDKVKKVVNDWGGACKARNAGFKESKGNIVSFWDCDSFAEPEMAMVWMMFFDQHADCDFVYGQYKWTDPGIPGYDSEPNFDPWLLTRYNYLCSMWPVKREKVVGWDENLTGLQDWDFWRRVVSGGAKGYFNRGYGFSTEFPDRQSISGQGQEVKADRIRAIRAKFNDPDSDILVVGYIHKPQAMRIAKLLDADYFLNTDYYKIKEYKLVMAIGFNYQEMDRISGIFKGSVAGTKKSIYWTGMDCMELACGPYLEVKKWKMAINESVHYNFCPDVNAKNTLADVGIEAEVLSLPRGEGMVLEPLPDKFRVLTFSDEQHQPYIEALITAMPDIQFDRVVEEKNSRLADYSVILRLTGDKRFNDGDRNALIQGRYMISNVEAPYAGYMEVGEIEPFVSSAMNKIYEYEKVKEINKEAREYYLNETSPDTFKSRILEIVGPKLEVVA